MPLRTAFAQAIPKSCPNAADKAAFCNLYNGNLIYPRIDFVKLMQAGFQPVTTA
jgi:hypothetical protein